MGLRELGRGIAACCLAAAAAGGTKAAEPAAAHGALLDEINVDVYRGPDTARLAAGLTFGDVSSNGFYVYYGGRLVWTQFLDRAPRVRGVGLGGVAGIGYRPERWLSPVSGIALDRVYGTHGRFNWQTAVHAGVRMRVSESLSEHYAVTFALYHQNILGRGDFPDQSDTGLAILLSAARYDRH